MAYKYILRLQPMQMKLLKGLHYKKDSSAAVLLFMRSFMFPRLFKIMTWDCDPQAKLVHV